MFWRARREIHDCERFVKFLEDFKPDAVNWWNMNGMTKMILPLPNRMGIPDIHAVDDLWLIHDYGPEGKQSEQFWHRLWDAQWGPASARSLMRPLLKAWEQKVHASGLPTRCLAHRPAQVCFLSEYMRRVHGEAGIDISASRVIYGGVAKERFFQRLPKSRHPAEPLRLLYAGQVTPDRGLMTVIDALGELPEQTRSRLTLTVAGTGPQEFLNAVHARIRDLGLVNRISLLGKVVHSDIAGIFKGHDVFIFASKRPEGLGFVCIEAMLAGCAVVTTGSGGAKEIADVGRLPMFRPDNPASLSVLLSRLEGQREEVAEIAARGQAAALEKFSFEEMMAAWLCTFDEFAKVSARK